MEPQPKQKKEQEPRTYSATEFPKEELASQSGDDEDAEPEVDKVGEQLEAARPWRVAKSLLTLRDQVNAKFPNRSKASDGTIGDAAHASRSSDHNPWVTDGNKGVVTAMDITHDTAHSCDCNLLAQAITASKDSRVKYVIWNSRIARSYVKNGKEPWTWLPYTGANKHNHHMHVSVKDKKASYDSTQAWSI
jgi:hypothetical protein